MKIKTKLLLSDLTVVEPTDMKHLNPRTESTSICTPLQTIRYICVLNNKNAVVDLFFKCTAIVPTRLYGQSCILMNLRSGLTAMVFEAKIMDGGVVQLGPMP